MNVVQCMTHAALAKALKLSRPTISRDVAEGMPLDVKGAEEWRDVHKEFRGEKTGPKPKIEYDDELEPQLPKFVRRELKEYSIAKQISKLDARDSRDRAKMDELRAEYDKIARLVQADYLDRIDCALNRRLLSTFGSPDDCFESFVKDLVELADKWRDVLETEAEEA